MNLEANRLQTFAHWPTVAPVEPARLARGGFFYTGQGTEVQCFSCNGKISQWNYGDQVMSRHRILEPNCTFVAHPSLSGNVTSSFSAPSGWSEEGLRHFGEEESDVVRATQDYGLTEEDEMYRSDALRLLSFVNWDDNSVSREALVNAGFYHSGGGRLRCAWCGGELAPFNSLGSLGSTPLEIHRMYFPRCDHAATLLATHQSSQHTMSLSPQPDTPPLQSPVTSDNVPQSSGAAHNARILNARGTWRALGVVGGGARHVALSSLAARLATFDRWPSTRTQTPLALAKAGFFHTGIDDQVDEVRCFYCDGGLGKWEPGDAPWTEHARWFPTCGYVQLLKGQQFVDTCEPRPHAQPTASTESRAARRNTDLPVTEEQITECLESAVGLGALAAGLDAARVRRAIGRRLRAAGTGFSTAEGLIDAVLDSQLSEEPWGVSTNSQRLALDILADTIRELTPSRINRHTSDSSVDGSSRSEDSPSPSADRVAGNRSTATGQNRSPVASRSPINNRTNISPSPTPTSNGTEQNGQAVTQTHLSVSLTEESESGDRTLSLEEENRQLKESRLCKVCMDSEVSVVFLPCGHLVSCARCGAALAACPLCRAHVKALVRAYLA